MKRLLLLNLILILFLSGCGGREKIGVINQEKLIQAAPRFSQVEELNKQIKLITARSSLPFSQEQSPIDNLRQAMKSRILGLSSVYQKEMEDEYRRKEEEGKALIQKLNKEMEKRLEQREKVLEEKFKTLLEQKKKEVAKVEEEYREKISEEYDLKRLNLSLKLKTLRLTEEERKDLNKRIEDTRKEQREGMRKKDEELKKIFADYKEEEEKELRMSLLHYQEELKKEAEEEIALERRKWERELKEKVKVSSRQIKLEDNRQGEVFSLARRMREKGANFPDEDSKMVFATLLGLRRQRERLIESILKDIKVVGARVAKKKKLSLVLSNYQVNVSASDLTREIIKEAF